MFSQRLDWRKIEGELFFLSVWGARICFCKFRGIYKFSLGIWRTLNVWDRYKIAVDSVPKRKSYSKDKNTCLGKLHLEMWPVSFICHSKARNPCSSFKNVVNDLYLTTHSNPPNPTIKKLDKNPAKEGRKKRPKTLHLLC